MSTNAVLREVRSMATIGGAGDPVESVGIDGAIARMAAEAMRTSPIDVLDLLDFMCQPLGARAARFYVADYSLRTLQQIGTAGPVGARLPIAGTMIGRVFTSGEIQVARTDPTVVSVPLVEGSCPIGVLELDVDVWDDRARDLLQSLAGIFVMAWIVKTRYTDQSARARRSERLAPAAEVQWDLLPPLSCSAEQVALSGLLEPAYDLGGDSFDYAFDKTQVDFAILDAVGHGLPAVLMSAAAINSLRNTRRARGTLSAAYHSADRSIAAQFGESSYVTGVILGLGAWHLRMGQRRSRPAHACAERQIRWTAQLQAVTSPRSRWSNRRNRQDGSSTR